MSSENTIISESLNQNISNPITHQEISDTLNVLGLENVKYETEPGGGLTEIEPSDEKCNLHPSIMIDEGSTTKMVSEISSADFCKIKYEKMVKGTKRSKFINECKTVEEIDEVIYLANLKRDAILHQKLVDSIKERIEKDGYSIDTDTYEGDEKDIKKLRLRFNLEFVSPDTGDENEHTDIEVSGVDSDQDEWVTELDYNPILTDFENSEFEINEDDWEADDGVFLTIGCVYVTLHYKQPDQPLDGIIFDAITENGYEDGFVFKEGKLHKKDRLIPGSWTDMNMYVLSNDV